MNTDDFSSNGLGALDAGVLLTRLAELLRRERRCVIDVLWHLAEVDRRGLHLELGHPSLFAYCTDALGLTKASAWRRSTGARLLARFPAAEPYLMDGRLCLTTFVLLRDVLRPENHERTLALAAGRTEDEVKALVATLSPRPDIEDSVRKVTLRPVALPLLGIGPELPAAAVTSSIDAGAPLAPPEAFVRAASEPGSGPEPGSAPPAVLPVTFPPPPPARIEPLNPDRYALRISVGKAFLEELEEVKAALSHVVPDGKLESVLRECIRRTLDACSKKRKGAPYPKSDRSKSSKTVTCATAKAATVGSGPELTNTHARPIDAEGPSAGSGPELTNTHARPLDAEAPSPGSGPGLTNTHAHPIDAEARAAGSGPELANVHARDDEGADHRCSGPELKTVCAQPRTRYIPAQVRRAVMERDEGRCVFVSAGGHRCNSRHQLEFEHREPFARGGPSTVENVELLCRAHNQHRARQLFGAAHMEHHLGRR